MRFKFEGIKVVIPVQQAPAQPAFPHLQLQVFSMFLHILAFLPLLAAVSGSVLPALLQDNVARSLSSRAVAPSLSLDSSQWIWTGEEGAPGGSAPLGSRPFRKALPASEKCPICATILISADNAYELYVNGLHIGGFQSFAVAQVYTVALKEFGENVFAVNASNLGTGGPASLIATILVEYTDGTSATFNTDSSWKTLQTVPPPGWAEVGTVDLLWRAASEQGLEGVAPWGKTGIPPFLDLETANWIWTDENVNGQAPIAARAFRKTVGQACDRKRKAVCAKVVITADNAYTLYVNGETIGSGSDFTSAQAYSITELDPFENVFAVNAANVAPGGPASLIAIIQIAYSDGTSETYITDGSWKAFKGVPAGFQVVDFDDGAWPAATVLGAYGVAPWGNVAIPSA